MSRLCDRVTRRASPGLDTDLSGLGLSFLYSGNVTLFGKTSPSRRLRRDKSILRLVTASEMSPGSGNSCVVQQAPHAAALEWSTRNKNSIIQSSAEADNLETARSYKATGKEKSGDFCGQRHPRHTYN